MDRQSLKQMRIFWAAFHAYNVTKGAYAQNQLMAKAPKFHKLFCKYRELQIQSYATIIQPFRSTDHGQSLHI